MSLFEMRCTHCGHKEDFFKDEITRTKGNKWKARCCLCGENLWEKVRANPHVMSCSKTYSANRNYPDSMDQKHLTTAKNMEFENRNHDKEKMEKQQTFGNTKDDQEV